MDKLLCYNRSLTNLAVLRDAGLSSLDSDYICPLCMRSFSKECVRQEITEEHVPQKSLGGIPLTLTCKDCNSSCGSDIDVYLFESIQRIEQRAFLPGTDRRVSMQEGDGRLYGTLKVGENQDLLLNIDTKHNNPKTWNYFHDNILLEDSIIDIQDFPLKQDVRRSSAAILKNAYLFLFARTGYTFLSDTYYDSLRKQIMNPDAFILPERLWTFQNVSVQDGIYLTQDNRYRGFFIVYTLKLHGIHRVCVLIPTPKVEYLSACMCLRTIEPNVPIRILSLPNEDFLCDATAIARLKEWCYGWSLVF